ncbi:hypothetical protein WG66_016181 [Moniliophthora roreri]|nr:hypothetical protein WG66_016181 [Moniliophthora roreri]
MELPKYLGENKDAATLGPCGSLCPFSVHEIRVAIAVLLQQSGTGLVGNCDDTGTVAIPMTQAASDYEWTRATSWFRNADHSFQTQASNT